jgi:ABC-type sugar transport system ATPase subunit
VVILDEPTSVLARPEAERLWKEIRALATAGTAVVLITHKLEDVAACADRVAVMRAGRLVGETNAVEDQGAIVSWMMGAAAPPVSKRTPGAPGTPAAPRSRPGGYRDAVQVQCPHLQLGRGRDPRYRRRDRQRPGAARQSCWPA